MAACAGSPAQPRVARGQVPAPNPASHSPPPGAAAALSTAPASEPEVDADQAFIDNAELAISQYREFLARAGADEQYALAATRSRQQIDDLEASIDFVRAGMRDRTAR